MLTALPLNSGARAQGNEPGAVTIYTVLDLRRDKVKVSPTASRGDLQDMTSGDFTFPQEFAADEMRNGWMPLKARDGSTVYVMSRFVELDRKTCQPGSQQVSAVKRHGALGSDQEC